MTKSPTHSPPDNADAPKPEPDVAYAATLTLDALTAKPLEVATSQGPATTDVDQHAATEVELRLSLSSSEMASLMQNPPNLDEDHSATIPVSAADAERMLAELQNNANVSHLSSRAYANARATQVEAPDLLERALAYQPSAAHASTVAPTLAEKAIPSATHPAQDSIPLSPGRPPANNAISKALIAAIVLVSALILAGIVFVIVLVVL